VVHTKYSHISLCAGYGGIDIGLGRVLPSIATICSVEIEAYAVANLLEKMETGQVVSHPVWSNIETFDARPFCGKVDILSGGFPCQPFSQAGNQKSTDDERHLFPHIERIIFECKPRIVFFENVEGIISAKVGGTEQSVLHHVLQRVERLGYRVTAGLFSAEECGFPHRRKRAFVAGVRNSNSCVESTVSVNDETSRMSKHSELDNTFCFSSGRNGGEVQATPIEVERQRTQPPAIEYTSGHGERRDRLDNNEMDNSRHNECGRPTEKNQLPNSSNTGLQRGKLKRPCHEINKKRRKREKGTHGTIAECRCTPRLDKKQQLPNSDSEYGRGKQRPAQPKGELFRQRTENDSSIVARPTEKQHPWEYPRTIGSEKIVTTLDGSIDGIAADLVHSVRVDALRMIGNGVVPDTAAKAFCFLISELSHEEQT